MKSILSIGLAVLLVVSLAACGPKKEAEVAEGANQSTEAVGEAAVEVKGLTEPIAEKPLFLTSAGQSADVDMVRVLLEKGGLEVTENSLATSADLGDAKTLILSVGGSSKGLGAAGIDADQEIKRVEEITAAAKEKGLTVIAVHIGGAARRGDLSDRFIEPSLKNADYMVITADGDQDGALTAAALKAGIPLDVVDSKAAAVTPLVDAFKK